MSMKVLFCGVGEAFDETLSNTSIFVEVQEHGNVRKILLDCGFTAAPSFWRFAGDPLDLDALWISHLHGDHFLGLPQLLIRFSEHGRVKPLQISGVSGTSVAVKQSMELAYPGKWDRLGFEVQFIEASPEETLHLGGIQALAIPVEHSVPCLGIKLHAQDLSIFYTGDGRLAKHYWPKIEGCHLAVCEAFALEADVPGHSSVSRVTSMARQAGIRQTVLVHMQRQERRKYKDSLPVYLEEAQINGFLPEPGDRVELQKKGPGR
ncbi:MBL fold metallo-hydrolase [Desulfonatronospira sp.]|uniref:MBL fold metallo-hydrolase n=1 Tax=Desulfonatronospira sp. TaxID=1962951 RepID=UPI0025BA7F11|nr:MBL fold metallo-hydrolase [Desulfonatronospira sp.]